MDWTDTASYVTIRSPWKPGEEPFSSIMSQQANVSPPHPRKTELQKPASVAQRRYAYRRRPRRPPFLLVESEGVGVTSSMRPIFMPERARARRADWAPGPGVLVELPDVVLVSWSSSHIIPRVYSPPVARILMWRAVMPSSLQRTATS